MHSSTNTILAATAGVAGGVAIGLYLGSRRGTELRSRVGERIRHGTHRIEQQLGGVEQQLHELEQIIMDARHAFVERLGLTGQPDGGPSPDVSSEWGLSQGEVVKELPNLPRR